MDRKELYLREATIEDRVLLYEWANDPEVRNSSFKTDPIEYEEHCKWFERIFVDDKELQYILMDGREPVGQARLSISDEVAEIDYSVAPAKRGIGYGSVIINLLKQKVFEELPNVKKLIAKVKPKNIASIYCFENNQFKEKYQKYEYNMSDYKPIDNESNAEVLGIDSIT